ncbi:MULTISPECIES: carbohydrate kinase family protein [Streptomyces]|uniref:Carbohydrate kinase family protein n=2 Tax=Streptomyces TaxID=1883 RepID=A0A3R7IV36_9ACTN|nr:MULTISPECIES: carbohydrate kinase family protein [Streptomyces]KNE81216.1 ribokinase [Streptomyces fradiae]OFA46727.1 ribokinase [Streptomyces fradiae]PQM22292.1 carbohydrate kinase family protein [Streptomyces xinghaiensis]RKM96739.1 carbohydrate kinase family protein [Streptomyces xinghaiensis]RNC74109.1 carbohydrate kinase family protein [Streptomyces xinghaiensis]
MRIAVTGSIATDHLMVFPGRFTEQLIKEELEQVSLSFLADRLEVRRGGVGANIAFGLGLLGLDPLLVGAAGVDFAEYDAWLRANGVDTAAVRVSDQLHTARFVCTTDDDQNQIATFYAGAMAEARRIDLAALAGRPGSPALVLVGADDPAAMLRHTATAHHLGIPVAADPSQQLARLDRDEARQVVDRAQWLFTNEYEAALLLERTGWTRQHLLDRIGTWITTLGEAGVSLARSGAPTVRIPAVPADEIADPTGAGDAFRAGFLAGTAWQWPQEQAARLGCALATTVLESVGTQEYKLTPSDLVGRIDRTYGSAAARAVEPRLERVR